MRATLRSRRLAVLAAMLGSLAATAPLSAQNWFATLGPEVNGATGTGQAAFSLNGSLLSISASWSGLTGTTTVAHIHCCTAQPGAGTIGVAVTPGTLPGFPVGVTAGSYATVIDLSVATNWTTGFVNNFGGGTLAGAQAALISGFENDRAYFNIHSTAFPGGEIRGFIAPVPEPATLPLLGVSLLALGAVARRRRHG